VIFLVFFIDVGEKSEKKGIISLQILILEEITNKFGEDV